MRKIFNDVRPNTLRCAGKGGCELWFPDSFFYDKPESPRRRGKTTLCKKCNNAEAEKWKRRSVEENFEKAFERIIQASVKKNRASA